VAFALRCAGLLGTWWGLTEGSGGWAEGAVAAVLVAFISLRLTPPSDHVPRPWRLPSFVLYFSWQSLRAGFRVAQMTLSPRLPLQPGLLAIPLALPPGAPTWWLMLTVTLLPGTSSVELEAGVLEVHCLDRHSGVLADVREAERQVARLFGCGPLAGSRA
jgi:multicomponent Na+:H+ antiporter subunit E